MVAREAMGVERAATGAEGIVAGSGGAPEGFEEFFRAQYPVTTRVAWSVVRDLHLAEDVAQEAMIAAGRRFGDFDDAGHAIAWTRMAAVHLALNEVRSRRRRDDRHRRARTVATTGAAGVAGGAAGPEELALERHSRDEVREVLARLPRHSATVLVLRHSGLSYAEVASAMGVKVGHVGTMLRRAEAAMRKEVTRDART